MKILNQIKICSKVGLHAWYDTDLGFVIRKPIGSEWPHNKIKRIFLSQELIPQYRAWWRKLWDWIKMILKVK